MEALFSVCSNSLFSSLQNHTNTTLKLQCRVSIKPHDFHNFPPFVASRKRVLKCIDRNEQLETSFDEGESLKNGVRRKNLAVFVSGGGSNFQAVIRRFLWQMFMDALLY